MANTELIFDPADGPNGRFKKVPLSGIDGAFDKPLLGGVNEFNKSDGSTAKYYELPDDAQELQHLISHRDMNSQIGEIFRACYRYGIVSHSDKLRDAKKIKFYADAEIDRLERLI